MEKRKVSLILLLLTFLSGEFSVNRLDIGSDLEVKYLLFALFLFSMLLPKKGEKVRKKKFRLNKPLLVFLGLTFLYFYISFGSVYYSPSPIVAFDKMKDMLFLCLLVISLVYILSKFKQEEYIELVTIFFILVGWFYVVPIYLSFLLGSGRGRFSLGGPNVTTRILFFSAISLIYRFKSDKKIKTLVSAIIMLGGIVLIGSRGGMVGAIAAFAILFLCKKVLRKWSIKKNPSFKVKDFVYITIAFIVGSVIYETVKDMFFNRFIRLTFGGNKIYTSGRDIIYSQSIDMIKEQPFLGYGLNGYSVVTGGNYPHNIVLELMNDIGLFGLFFFIIILLFSVILVYKLRNKKVYIFSALPFYMVIVHLFSGGIYDFRYFFFWAIPLIYYFIPARKRSNIRQVPLNEIL